MRTTGTLGLVGSSFTTSDGRSATSFVWKNGIGPRRHLYGRYASANDRIMRAALAVHRLSDAVRDEFLAFLDTVQLGRFILSTDREEGFAAFQGFRSSETEHGGFGSPEEIHAQARAAIAGLANMAINGQPRYPALQDEDARAALIELVTGFLTSLGFGTDKSTRIANFVDFQRSSRRFPTYGEFRDEVAIHYLAQDAAPPTPTDPAIAAERLSYNGGIAYKNSSLWKWLSDYLSKVAVAMQRSHNALVGLEVGMSVIEASLVARRDIHPLLSGSRIINRFKDNVTVKLCWMANDGEDDTVLPDITPYAQTSIGEILRIVDELEPVLASEKFPIAERKNFEFCSSAYFAIQPLTTKQREGADATRLLATIIMPTPAMPVGAGTRHVVTRLAHTQGQRFKRKQGLSKTVEQIQAELLNLLDLDRWSDTIQALLRNYTNGFTFACIDLDMYDCVHIAVAACERYTIAGQDGEDPWMSGPPELERDALFEFKFHRCVPDGTLALMDEDVPAPERVTGVTQCRDPLLLLAFADLTFLKGGGEFSVLPALMESDVEPMNQTVFPAESIDYLTLNPNRNQLYADQATVYEHDDPELEVDPIERTGNVPLIRLLGAANPRTATHLIYDETTAVYANVSFHAYGMLFAMLRSWRPNLFGLNARTYWSETLAACKTVRAAAEVVARSCSVATVYDWEHLGDIHTEIEVLLVTVDMLLALILAPSVETYRTVRAAVEYHTAHCGIGDEMTIDALAEKFKQ